MGQEEIKPKKFGPFVLLDHLVNGGMAIIYRAMALSMGGNQQSVSKRIIAIKMINEVFSKDENYKIMFNDEVKLAFGLSHPNIAQIYSFGEEDGKLYTAMEYISGKNLRQYEKLPLKFPKEIIVHIIAHSALGLDYVHKFSDKFTGQHLKIIHRDISPQNIMLCYNGDVKIVDFGIAKSASNTQETQAGTLKGKVSYLAPEYLNEETTLDARYDQFALGIVFWEMLTGTKLFDGPNEMAIIKKVFECSIPDPTIYNPLVDDELKCIVLKMLSKNKEDRYPDMAEVAEALNLYLIKNFQDFNQKSIESFLIKNIKNDILIEQEKIKEFGALDLEPFVKDVSKENIRSEDFYLSPRERKMRELEKVREKRKLQRENEITINEQLRAEQRKLFQEKLRQEQITSAGLSPQKKELQSTVPKDLAPNEIERKPLEKTGITKKTQQTKTLGQVKLPQKMETKGLPKRSEPENQEIKSMKNESDLLPRIAVGVLLVSGGYFVYQKLQDKEVEHVSSIADRQEKSPASVHVVEKALPPEVLIEGVGRIVFEGVTPLHEVFIDEVKLEKLDTPFELAFNKKIKIKIMKENVVLVEQVVVLTAQDKEQVVILP